MAKKAKLAVAQDDSGTSSINIIDDFEPGTGSKRAMTRLIALYGAPKSRKTTACSTIKGAKWIVSDSNCIPTLKALGRLPPSKDIYEVDSSRGAKELLEKMIEAAADGKLVLPAAIIDSMTQLNDWLQQDIAKETGQSFLGENPKNNGWQQYNGEMGALIDAIAELSRYMTVVVVCHAKEKADASKGDYNGLNLPPQMALKMARCGNWLLYQNISSRDAKEGEQSDDFIQIAEAAGGKKMAIETIIHTVPVGLWSASVNATNLHAEEPADLAAMLRKEGLL